MYWHPNVVLHVSVVQTLPSLQVMGVYLHPVVASHESAVQALPSLQVMGV